ncbi:MAG: hypothetical protein Q7K28_01585 [Candidatus Wildermuthbacteria bacterium]|nr:hypothetical protein [Candidatus Wildermuthbacteria bacterium]
MVDLIVARARVDTTAPDPDNSRSGWRTSDLFTQDVDALVVGQWDDPASYAEIGRLVLKRVRDLPEVAVLARLAILRGKRLLPVTLAREGSILRLAERIEKAIAVLPDGTRKMRCKSLFEYHMGIFYDAYGRFDLAAFAHMRAVEEADGFGDRPGAAISLFMATFCFLKDALGIGRPSVPPEVIFSKLEERFAQLVEAMRGSTLEVQWAEENGPFYMIEACVWLDRNHLQWDDWVHSVSQAGKKLGDSCLPLMEFVRAVNMSSRGFSEADDALRAINEGHENEMTTALLILARRAVQAGRMEEARKFVEQMPKLGAQHIRAIAARLLES